MAKRARGTTTRPGQRAPLQRTGTRPTPSTRPNPSTRTSPATPTDAPSSAPAKAPRPATLTAEEEARAAELEAAIMAEERAAEAGVRKNRDRSRRGPTTAPESARLGGLALQATDEYAYVARDVRRIGLVGGSLLVFLFGLWVVMQATGLGRI